MDIIETVLKSQMFFPHRLQFGIIFILAMAIGNAQADRIAFFYALDTDIAALASVCLAQPQTSNVSGRKIGVFKIGTHEIIAIKMGAGPVETAISCQTLLSKYRCDLAFSLGPVGSIDDKIKVGTWIQVSGAVAYQKGSFETTGFILSQKSAIHPPTKGFLRVKDILPKLLADAPESLAASGEAFIASNSYREQLNELTQAQIVDMNFFGLMSVCVANDVPLVSWRIVSDNADENAPGAFHDFVEKYDGAGGKLLAEVIAKLPPNPESPDSYPAIKKALESQ